MGFHFILVESLLLLQLYRKLNVFNSVLSVPGCKPARKIAFLKTYKCGTSTILKMLLKLAILQKLLMLHRKYYSLFFSKVRQESQSDEARSRRGAHTRRAVQSNLCDKFVY